MKIKPFLLLAVMAMTAAPAALAQTTSPYSKFGYGLPHSARWAEWAMPCVPEGRSMS